MNAARTLAYCLVLLEYVAARERMLLWNPVESCSELAPGVGKMAAWWVDECLQKPEIAAVAEGFSGNAEDKMMEINLQCSALRSKMFSGGVLDIEAYKESIRRTVRGTYLEASVNEGLNTCDSSLLHSYQVTSYYRCLEQHC